VLAPKLLREKHALLKKIKLEANPNNNAHSCIIYRMKHCLNWASHAPSSWDTNAEPNIGHQCTAGVHHKMCAARFAAVAAATCGVNLQPSQTG
jgi:hypothetical protein